MQLVRVFVFDVDSVERRAIDCKIAEVIALRVGTDRNRFEIIRGGLPVGRSKTCRIGLHVIRKHIGDGDLSDDQEQTDKTANQAPS
jgi:hypothetical protein